MNTFIFFYIQKCQYTFHLFYLYSYVYFNIIFYLFFIFIYIFIHVFLLFLYKGGEYMDVKFLIIKKLTFMYSPPYVYNF